MMFYGVDGKRLAKCQIQEVSYPAYGYTFACTGITYFLGQVVTGEGESGGWGPWGAARDRLGSVRAAPYGYYYHDQGVNASSYFPYGQARTGGNVWATYQPSSVSGTMYAMNREYSAAYGRFLTPDPYMASGEVADPGSWNRYAYTQGDPVNYTDPSGLYLSVAGLPPATPLVAINTSEIGVARLLGLAESEHYELFLARQVGGRPSTIGSNAGSNPLSSALAIILAPNTNCYKDITKQFGAAPSHGSIEDMKTKISEVRIWDTNISGVADLSLRIVVPGADEKERTLGGFVGNDYAGVPYLKRGPNYKLSHDIVLGQAYRFNEDGTATSQVLQYQILTHEMLHIYTGRNDADLATGLGLVLNGADPSSAIGAYIKSDCTRKVF